MIISYGDVQKQNRKGQNKSEKDPNQKRKKRDREPE
jgi:hypothetical protein